MAPKYPTLGSSVSFTCSIKFTDTITDPVRVQFFVNGENVATFTQKSSECNLKSVSENRYNGTCGSVPNAPLETYYSITILKPEVRDGGHFYCQLEERTMKSNSIVLKFSSKCSSIIYIRLQEKLKERKKCFIYLCTQLILFIVISNIWCQTSGKGPLK